MKNITALFLFLIYSMPTLSADLRTAESATDALVSILVDSYAREYRAARKIHYPGGQVDVAVVFFTIESFTEGNNYTQYLAVFEPSFEGDPELGKAPDKISKYRLVGYLPVGGNDPRRGSVDFSQVALDKQKITIQRKEYGSKDALCCPSKPSAATYKITDREIVREKTD